MAATIRVDVVNRETIKPSSPTPHHLRVHKISIIDQSAPVMYTCLVIFYANNDETKDYDSKVAAQKSECLKKSLSRVLTLFYPFAGRIKDYACVDCNDEGAAYVETRVNCRLSDILQQPNLKLLKQFYPVDFRSTEAVTGLLLLVQANFFQCGGLGMTLCISHKFADAHTFSIFLKSWVAMALDPDKADFPEFVGASLFPPIEFEIPYAKPNEEPCVTRMSRFVFNASKISILQAKARSETVPNPTRVEVVAALLWKCSRIASASIRKQTLIRESRLTLPVNFRSKLTPPVAENSPGNFVLACTIHSGKNEIELKDLVGRIRKAKEEFDEIDMKMIRENNILGLISKRMNVSDEGNVDHYAFTSLCRVPFSCYATDFGWGKPLWAGCAEAEVRNIGGLIDQKDGVGIEAWFSLDEKEMDLLETNKELLEFASVNPSVSLKLEI